MKKRKGTSKRVASEAGELFTGLEVPPGKVRRRGGPGGNKATATAAAEVSSVDTRYDTVRRLAVEDPEWLPVVRACFEFASGTEIISRAVGFSRMPASAGYQT